MKINKIILKNFSAIKNAMKSDEIEIDFSNAENKVCLIIGKNGSGKTSLLSQLHPFSDVGNLDVRNGNDLILKDKDGYKEIHIIKNKDYYIIKHYYTHHKDKGHSVKSYISKNGVELNINGNVSSFKEYVKEELQIESDYLKLIRLGSNVTSLIDLTATERKNFMSKIMDDIGVYLEYYKAVNNKMRQLDEMMSHTTDKIEKINIVDKDGYEKDIKHLNDKIDEEDKIFIKENGELSILNSKFNEIEDKDDLSHNLSETKKKYNKMVKVLERKSELDTFEASFYKDELDKLSKKKEVNKVEYNSNISIINNLLKRVDELNREIRNYDIQISKAEESNIEIKKLSDKVKEDKEQLRIIEKNTNGISFPFTKKEFDEFIVALKNIQVVLNTTYEFGNKPISKVVELMKDGKNVPHYINSHLMNLTDSINSYDAAKLQSTLLMSIITGKPVKIQCKDECVAKDAYNRICNMLESLDVVDKDKNEDFYRDMDLVYKNIISVLPKFSAYKDIIDNLPDDIKEMFKLDNIYDNIKSCKPIYDDKKINDLISIVSELEYYDELSGIISKNEENLKFVNSMSNLQNLYEQVKELNDSLDENRNNIKKYKERNKLIEEECDEISKTVEIYTDILETIEKFDEIKALYEKYDKDYNEYVELKANIHEMQIVIDKHKIYIDNLKKELSDMQIKLSQYKSLTKELERMVNIYDETNLVKEALSSKKGIPLYFIGNYLSNTEEITNELLDIAYNGRIYIDNFNITPTEFSIPFFNNGIRLDDVKYASQGELSFLSIALSFALSSQALSKYNIMLLDEIDGPLDTTNREKFIQILENQIDRIDSEQSFLITHNDMFSSYPVDIIDLSYEHNDDYKLANYIPIKK